VLTLTPLLAPTSSSMLMMISGGTVSNRSLNSETVSPPRVGDDASAAAASPESVHRQQWVGVSLRCALIDGERTVA
jgi:hypothetical protein